MQQYYAFYSENSDLLPLLFLLAIYVSDGGFCMTSIMRFSRTERVCSLWLSSDKELYPNLFSEILDNLCKITLINST